MDSEAYELQYNQRIEGGLKPGARITIIGQADSNPSRMSIDLCQEEAGWTRSLHFNPRFNWGDCNKVIMNSLLDNNWGVEEGRDTVPFPFKAGTVFKIVIRCDEDRFHFTVNDSELCSYRYRDPLENVKFVRVEGTVDVIHVDVRNHVCYCQNIMNAKVTGRQLTFQIS